MINMLLTAPTEAQLCGVLWLLLCAWCVRMAWAEKRAAWQQRREAQRLQTEPYRHEFYEARVRLEARKLAGGR